MKVQLFALCDAATESGGKLNILGVFDTLHSRNLPVALAQCAIAIRVRFESIERGEHRIRINIVDADGGYVIPSLDAPLRVNFPDRVSSVAVNLILNLQNLKFNRFGEYSIDLAIDGRQEASIPLWVREIPGVKPGPRETEAS